MLVASAPRPTADEALERLKRGNQAFIQDEPVQIDTSHDRRLSLATGQEPFATLIGCSDSRVGPELLFGAGLGELFIVRNAGNNVDTAGLGSVEYSVAVLGVPLIVVLGHEKCGAVQAATQVVTDNAQFPGAIGQMIEPIIPAVLSAQRGSDGGDHSGDLVERSIEENVRRMVARLKTYSEPTIMEPLMTGKLKIVGAVYSLATGEVRWL